VIVRQRARVDAWWRVTWSFALRTASRAKSFDVPAIVALWKSTWKCMLYGQCSLKVYM
jgi:hypothetical protein